MIENRKQMGLVFIGQAPRPDILKNIREMISSETEIIQKGALDGLGKNEIESLSSPPPDQPLVTTLKSGDTVRVSSGRILPYVSIRIDELETEGVPVILVMCTELFPEKKFRKSTVLWAGLLLRNMIDLILPEGKLGLLTPLEEQVPSQTKKWSTPGRKIIARALSPYETSEQQLQETAAEFARSRVDLTVADCISYDHTVKKTIRKITGKPVILPVSLISRLAADLML